MPEKMKMQATPMDKILEKVMELCPNAVQNGKINFERLREELSDIVDDKIKESYDFTWVGKRKAIVEASTPIRKTLRPIKEDSKNWDTTKNLYIEGDNLDALKLLQESYLGKVKMIYIDPPYNTGKNLIYKNNFKTNKDEYEIKVGAVDKDYVKMFRNKESNGLFHSDWCSIMYPRLKLSRDFLRDDGFMIVAIDHNELFNISKILDEIFGDNNRIAIVSVVHKPEGRNQEKFFGTSNEFMLIYAKNKNIAKFQNFIIDNDIENKFDFEDEFGKYKIKNFIRLSDGKYATKEAKPNFFYPIYISDDLLSVSLKPVKGYHEVLPVIQNGVERTWKTLPKTFIELFFKNNIVIDKNNDIITIYEKIRNQVIKTHWIKKEYHAYHFGTKILEKLLQLKTFDFPKSLFLMKDICQLSTNSNDIILDFFSGSATTAHAVMQLNAEDGGNRKFIMVQLPEPTDEKAEAYKAGYKNICDIGKERIRRAGEKIKTDNPNAKDLDIGFRVLKVDDTNMRDIYYTSLELNIEKLLDSVNNIKEGRTPLDLLFGVLVDWGLDLTSSITEKKVEINTIYIVNENDLVACFDEKISEKVINEIANLKPNRAVFRDSCFAKDDAKINTFELFKNISPETKIKVI